MGLIAVAALVVFVQPVRNVVWNVAVETVCDGRDVADLALMDERLSKKILPIIDTLKEEGYAFQVSSVHRSPARQKCLYDISKRIKKITMGRLKGVTTVSKGCHNNMKNGKPASLAIDLHIYESHARNVAFYLRLRALVRKAGLESGGDFKKTNPLWAKDDLGWDPGHVQVPACRSLLRIN